MTILTEKVIDPLQQISLRSLGPKTPGDGEAGGMEKPSRASLQEWPSSYCAKQYSQKSQTRKNTGGTQIATTTKVWQNAELRKGSFNYD